MINDRKILPNVSIIILNWNGWKDSIECLQSLKKIDYINYYIILIDNGSTDNSYQKLEEYVRENISYCIVDKTERGRNNINDITNKRLFLIRNELNCGFSEGNNIGIRYAIDVLKSDYILLLNNDTIVEYNFLSKLVEIAESKEEIGIAGPKIYYYNYPKKIQSIGVNINYWTGMTKSLGADLNDSDLKNIKDIYYVDYVYGACLLIKKRAIKDTGLLDPVYFLYGEETDLCLRAKKKGYKSCCYTDAVIWHKSEASSSKRTRYSLYYPIRNRLILLKRYSPKYKLATSIPFFITIKILLEIKYSGFNYRRINCIINAIKDGLFIFH